ncbi:MAG TPA: ACP S-malonyltransferase [Tepidisphaeraceae bacterium]|nr:ACP S-malonyltransferase [Tepidisphaeraceae bacterium]
MASKTFILCPGQGAQVVGMGKDFYESSPMAKGTFDTANDVLGFDIASLCFNGPEDRLNQTDISQPAIYTTSVAAYRAGLDVGVIDPSVITAFAGLSLGEYTALFLGGVFTFEDGLKLVAARGRFMQQAAVATPSGMVALLGADEAMADKLCAENAQGEVLVPANYNAPGQIVVSGSRAACDRVIKAAEAAGLKASALKVAGAFHSPLMQSGADKMRAELDAATFAAPATTVYSNVTAKPHGDPASIKDLLVQQIVSPVRWEQTMRTLITDGGDRARFVELAPNRHLAGLAKRINRRLPIESLSTVEGLRTKENLVPSPGTPGEG